MSTSLLAQVFSGSTPFASLSGADWETLLGQARTSQLLARLADWARHGEGGLNALPAPQRHYLQGAWNVYERQHNTIRHELALVRRALNEIQGPVVLLKGCAYLLADLQASRGRTFSDIDLLVRQEDLEKAENALLAHGWICSEHNAYNMTYYRRWMHEIPPLEHVRRASVIDLHHNIAPPVSRFAVDAEKLLKRIHPIGETGFHCLSPEDLVLHSVLHRYCEGSFELGLRDLLDIQALLTQFSDTRETWRALLERATELGLQEPLWHVLNQVDQTICGLPSSASRDELEQLFPSSLKRRWVAYCLALALKPKHPSTESCATTLSRACLYLRSHTIRMPLRLLLPHLCRKTLMRLPRFGD